MPVSCELVAVLLGFQTRFLPKTILVVLYLQLHYNTEKAFCLLRVCYKSRFACKTTFAFCLLRALGICWANDICRAIDMRPAIDICRAIGICNAISICKAITIYIAKHYLLYIIEDICINVIYKFS